MRNSNRCLWQVAVSPASGVFRTTYFGIHTVDKKINPKQIKNITPENIAAGAHCDDCRLRKIPQQRSTVRAGTTVSCRSSVRTGESPEIPIVRSKASSGSGFEPPTFWVMSSRSICRRGFTGSVGRTQLLDRMRLRVMCSRNSRRGIHAFPLGASRNHLSCCLPYRVAKSDPPQAFFRWCHRSR